MLCVTAVADTVLFDPCLHTTERQALAELGCGMIDENEKGAREVQRRTIFYMPHCEGNLGLAIAGSQKYLTLLFR